MVARPGPAPGACTRRLRGRCPWCCRRRARLLWGRRRYSDRGCPSNQHSPHEGIARILSPLDTLPGWGGAFVGFILSLHAALLSQDGPFYVLALRALGQPSRWATPATVGNCNSWEPQVPDLKAVLTAVLPPVPPNRAVVRLTYTIIPVGTLQVLLGMLCISPGEECNYLVMTCSEGAAKVWRSPLGAWTGSLKVHDHQGMKTFGLKAGLAAMKPTCPS